MKKAENALHDIERQGIKQQLYNFRMSSKNDNKDNSPDMFDMANESKG